MRSISRRDFLKDSALLSAALAGGGVASARETAKPAKKEGANDQLRIAIVGVNSRGLEHVDGFLGKPGVTITTVCDCDEGVIGKAMTRIEKGQKAAPKYVQDIRRLVEDKDVDIVSIATPNHWHALAAIWAMQNGKDVYVEKPVSHNVSEGRRIVEVSRATKKICQTGTQIRGHKGIRDAMQFLHDGKLGKVRVAHGLCYKRRKSIGRVKEAGEIPAKIDYDLWCGPAPMQKPLRRTKLHYDWHWTWDYGNGDLGNQGIHQMDLARWGLGKNEMAKSVMSLGGRFGYVDDGETANTQVSVFNYGDSELIFEVRGLETGDRKGTMIGDIFECENGFLVVTSYSEAVAFDPKGEMIQKFSGGGDHFANFLASVRNRKTEDLHADILEGHLSSALCHLANISYRLGTEEPFSKTADACESKAAKAVVEGMQEHLKTNGVKLDETKVRVGRFLKIDAKAETFVDEKEADRMLTREYRKGFEVPAKA